jgi:undecaprenyl-diphosphatase
MQTYDLSLFYWLNNFSGHSKIADYLIVFIGEYALYFYIVFFLYVVYRVYATKNVGDIALYIIAVASAIFARFGVASLIRYFYHHVRPYLGLHIPHLLSDTSYSFPSGHTIFFFALATGLLFVNKRFAYATYILGFIVGVARIMGGVHYPSDVLGGMILGIISGYVVFQGLYYALFGKTSRVFQKKITSSAKRS